LPSKKAKNSYNSFAGSFNRLAQSLSTRADKASKAVLTAFADF